MKIVKHPESSLLQPSAPVKIDKELTRFIDDMYVFMRTLPWGVPVGLAAPQVGRNIRVFIAIDNTYINPELKPIPEDGQTEYKEGCYSLDENKFDYSVRRYNSVFLKWQDKKGAWHEKKFTGFPAQVIQHEFDHLEGKLCCG